MTDVSLFYKSEVTKPLLYRFGDQVRALAAPMTPGTMTVDAQPSRPKEETDRRRAVWMVAAQAGDRAAYETLLRDCIPFIKRVARGQGVRPDFIDDVVQETLLTVHGRDTPTIRTAHSRLGSEQLRNGARSTDCAAVVGRVPAKFMRHSPMKTILILAEIPRKPHSNDRGGRFGHQQTLSRATRGSAASRTSWPIACAGRDCYRTVDGSLRVNWHRALKSLARPAWWKRLRSWSTRMLMTVWFRR